MQEKNLILGGIICIILGIIIMIAVNLEFNTIKINEPLDIKVYFCPKDNCKDVLISTIQASSKIHCALYDLDIPELIDLFMQKQALLVTDKSNKVSNSKTNKGYQLMHNKFCILDDETIITGSTNPTDNDVSKNNNNLIIIKSKDLSKNYEKEFQELYQGTFGAGEKTKIAKFEFINTTLENYFCPEDKCAEKVISHLKQAKESIYFMTYSFTHEGISRAIIKNIEVKGIIDTTQQVQDNKFDFLKQNGVDVIYDKNKYKMHHKVFIIDNKIVVLGSFNPTKAGDTKNDENILIIQNEEIAKKFTQEFIDLNLT